MALIFLICTLVECVCRSEIETHPLYKIWYVQKSEESQKAYILDLLETLKNLDAKEGEITALFLETLIRDQKVMSPWVRNYLKSFIGRDAHLDHWLYSILIASSQSKTVSDFMLNSEVLRPPGDFPFMIKAAGIYPVKKALPLNEVLLKHQSPTRDLNFENLFGNMKYEDEALALIFDLGHVADPEILDIKRKLYCNILMRISLDDDALWKQLYGMLMSPSISRALKLDLINSLYLRDHFDEASDILTVYLDSNDFLITAIAFKNLLDMCPTPEAVVKATCEMFRLLERFKSEPDKMARIFDLSEGSYLCPLLDKMKPFLEHKSALVRYKAFSFIMTQYERFNQHRTRLGLIQQYLPTEPNEDIQRMMVSTLLSQSWLNTNPARYMCLFDYRESYPNSMVNSNIDKFLTRLVQGAL